MQNTNPHFKVGDIVSIRATVTAGSHTWLDIQTDPDQDLDQITLYEDSLDAVELIERPEIRNPVLLTDEERDIIAKALYSQVNYKELRQRVQVNFRSVMGD